MIVREFVSRKLQLIADDLHRLDAFRDLSYSEVIADPIRLAAIERMLERIVMRAVDINEHLITNIATGEEPRTARLSYRETFLSLGRLGVLARELAERIAPSAGLRNVLVHEYTDADHQLVYRSIRTALTDYPAYVSAIDEYLTREHGV